MSTRKEDDEEEDKNSTPLWVWVILVIMLSLVIMFAVMYYLRQSNEAPPKAPDPRLQNLFKGKMKTDTPSPKDISAFDRMMRSNQRKGRKLDRHYKKLWK